MRLRDLALLTLGSAISVGCGHDIQPADHAAPRKMIVLGVDGMDPELLREYMKHGEMPNAQRLIATGGFRVLGTSEPPQSPVAWSNFITGLNPGGHGMFDFLALDRKNLLPYLTTSAIVPAGIGPLELGGWRIPLGSERVTLLRQGTAFWQLLGAAGVDVTIVRMPANYPPVSSPGATLSGMGTPDLRGTSGTFMFFSNDPKFVARDVSGGELRKFQTTDDRLFAAVKGPPNGLRVEATPLSTVLEVVPDPDHDVALVRGGAREYLVKAGEWSDWIGLEFKLLPAFATVTGMVRVHLKSVHPYLEMYVSPVNIDPRSPAQEISVPDDYAPMLAAQVGPFYTEEMPEDSKALSAHVLSADEYLDQSGVVLDESRRLLALELQRFTARNDPAFLFFYFSTIDQRHHMMGRHVDPRHPFFAIDSSPRARQSMAETYRKIDRLLGEILDRTGPQTAVVVMSDHGFANFYKQANLNAWLRDAGYLVLREDATPVAAESDEWLSGIDWSRTRAFSIGLNSLYINVAGREQHGIVPASERLDLAREIADRLRTWTDSENDRPVVTSPSLREEIYRGPMLAAAPDIIVGYGDGYRASWATSKGQTATELLEDNRDEWSADHCVDPAAAPGVLFANLPMATDAPQLTDLTVGILEYFDVRRGPQMRGVAPFGSMEVQRHVR
jgi:predicted AlkP superfamily phosphohydrolase/phosphomutase